MSWISIVIFLEEISSNAPFLGAAASDKATLVIQSGAAN